ncbi:MAG TPA: hypothetical protein PLU87_11490 [Sedimentisphaerales bacterium]|nr:hypothetical protein [Sedimentisphaerales bacterium]HRS12068.1 hypothetical protein [Sedimentisphaerales bacterium]HRV48499.1 hypothetical protein [Sedimentisphaerales bacterium]
MSRSVKTPHSVIAAVRDTTAFRAVALRKRNDGIEVLWAKSMPVEGGNWETFAAQCGLAARKELHGGAVSVIGLDATAVAFYRIAAPSVGQEETAAIVRMQAESLLPLPASQIEVAWRAMPSTNGTVDVTIAAARRDFLHRFVGEVRPFAPQAIVPACEGTARTWHELFGERQRQAVLVSIGVQHTQVCLVVDGKVANSAVLDTGMMDLSAVGAGSDRSSRTAEVVERFAQDLHTVLVSFGWIESAPWPVFALSDGRDGIDRIVEALGVAGVQARVSVPRPQTLGGLLALAPTDLYSYREPLGLGLMTLDGPATGLDLYAPVRKAEREQTARSAWHSTTLAAVVALLVLAGAIATSYVVDVASEKRLTALVNQPQFKQAGERQTLLKNIAQHRPDLLGLLTDIHSGNSEGVILDSFHFKKGQAVTLTGQADNAEQMWKFQANLLGCKSIKDVDITSTSTDSKTKKIKFTMLFHYKNFTKKGAAL